MFLATVEENARTTPALCISGSRIISTQYEIFKTLILTLRRVTLTLTIVCGRVFDLNVVVSKPEALSHNVDTRGSSNGVKGYLDV